MYPTAAPRQWPRPTPPPPVPRPVPEHRRERTRPGPSRDDVRAAAIVVGLMLFTALAATPFPTSPFPTSPFPTIPASLAGAQVPCPDRVLRPCG